MSGRDRAAGSPSRAVHEFWLGPAATRDSDGAPLRRPAALLARADGLLALLVVLLAAAPVRGLPW